MFLLPFREKEKKLQDRYIYGGHRRAGGPTVFGGTQGEFLNWREWHYRSECSVKLFESIAVCEFSHHSKRRGITHWTLVIRLWHSLVPWGATLELWEVWHLSLNSVPLSLQAKLVCQMLGPHKVELGDPLVWFLMIFLLALVPIPFAMRLLV